MSYSVLPMPALYCFVVPCPGEGDLKTVNDKELNEVCESNMTVIPVLLIIVLTCHCIERNYFLWHEEVEEVINMFSEKEPFGVDVRSHL